jgi:DNA-binding NarL/FixJ family response regulator
MGVPSIRVLVVEDYKPWLRFISSELQKLSNLQPIGEVSDGEEAVRQAQELQPDLILLDIGLPTINGIEAARRIREVSPASKILFVSENRSPEIAEQALNTGAGGYVLKSDAASELLPAIMAVLQGKRFVSVNLAGPTLSDAKDEQTRNHPHRGTAKNDHEVKCYPDDAAFTEGFASFIGTTLRNGDGVVVLATESHRASILQRLRLEGVDVGSAIEERRYVPLDVPDSLPKFQMAERLTSETVRAAAESNRRVGVG